MPTLLTVGLACVSGLNEDFVDLDWAFDGDATDDSFLDGVTSSVLDWFQSDAGAQTNAMQEYISSSRSRSANACTLDFYNLAGHLDGSNHGSPVRTTTWTLGGAPGDSDQFPDEVAVRMSLLADGWEDVPETEVNPSPPPVFFRPRARYRGGFYFGTVGQSTWTGTGRCRPNGTLFLADAGYAWTRFMDERGGDFGVWSRADADIKLIAPDGLITIDNAFDTIRKRGLAPTTRSTVWP